MATHNNNLYYATTATPVTAIPPPNAPPVPTSTNYKDSTNGGTVNPVGDHEMKRLKEQGFTEGLATSLNELQNNFPLRIWVVDNSGSMAKDDGHRIVSSKNNGDVKIVGCTRWKEIQEAVEYHVQISALIKAPTIFRLLNDPGVSAGSQEFDVATKGDDMNMIHSDVSNAMNIMSRTRPSGCTPLTQHITEIHATISAMKFSLQSEGKRAVVVLATDGLPTNEYGKSNAYTRDLFVQSLKKLEGLPVWLVIRLSTDEEDVVDFYNGLDEQLELSMDVLDDFCGEAAEIYEHNPWMNYALPLHRLREMGFHDRVLDMIDERPLTHSEIRDYCLLLFGVNQCDGLPDPETDWEGFAAYVDRLVSKEKLQWNPMKKKMMPWINMKKLNKKYGDEAGCVIM